MQVYIRIAVGNDELQAVAKTDFAARILEEQCAMLVAIKLILDTGYTFDRRGSC